MRHLGRRTESTGAARGGFTSPWRVPGEPDWGLARTIKELVSSADDSDRAGVVLSLSFNSDEYDPETGAVTYENGTHRIVAGVTVVGSEAEDYSQQWDVELENDDGYGVTADLGDNSAIGDDGRRWYGGPDNGTIDITALRVSYTGGSVTSVGANFCGEDTTDSDGSDGYTLEFECEDRESNTDGTDSAVVGDMLTISSPGKDGVILNDDPPFPAFVDFVGPSGSPIIVANRNGRENGWLNAAVALTGEVDADEDDDENWLIEGADETGGIGGYNMMLLMGEDLEKALEASPSSSLPAESADNDSYCAVASATDDLGNESGLPDAANDTCRAAPAGADVLVDGVWGQGVDGAVTDTSRQTLKFGVDTTAPTVEFANDYDNDNRHFVISGAGLAFTFEPEDDESNVGNSGLHSTDRLQVGIQRRMASETKCLTIGATDGAVGDAQADDKCETMAIDDATVELQTGADGLQSSGRAGATLPRPSAGPQWPSVTRHRPNTRACPLHSRCRTPRMPMLVSRPRVQMGASATRSSSQVMTAVTATPLSAALRSVMTTTPRPR